MNITHIFGQMGPMGWGVVITLLIMSIYSITVMIDKTRSFRAARKQSLQFLPEFVSQLKKSNFQGAIDTSRKYKKSHLAKVVIAGIQEFMTDEGEFADRHDLVNACGRALDRSNALTSAEMKQGLGGLATIGAVAPFVGLFGTVLGIMHSFSDIADQQNTSLAVVAPGIAEALLATAIGLFAAIPAVIAYNRFTHGINRLEARLQRFADGFHATLSRELEVEG